MPLNNTQSAFKRPPNFTYLGFEGRQQLLQNQEAPAIRPHQNQVVELQQVHRRASLLQGELLIKDTLKAGRSKVLLFVDNSSSCHAFFKKPDGLQHLTDNICSWLDYHHYEWKLFYSDAKLKLNWGPELWNIWHQNLSLHHDSIALVISDFHGNFPTGLFWKQLQTLPDARLIWWQHPTEEIADRDLEDPPHIQRKSLNHFTQMQTSWYNKLSETFSLMGLHTKKIQKSTYSNIERQVADYLS